MHKAISAFNASAVGAGSARLKFEKLLQSSLRKTFEVTLLLLIFLFPYTETCLGFHCQFIVSPLLL
jgi:hypothetical protein